MATRKPIIPLVIEPHPESYEGYPFVTLIQYRSSLLLTIVDNATDEYISAYVLDACGPESVDEQVIIDSAVDWFYNTQREYPLSVHFSRNQLVKDASKIYKSLNIEFVSRVIGPVPLYDMTTVKSVKRRRRKPLPANVTINKYTVSHPTAE
jgi:hypothetical protein